MKTVFFDVDTQIDFMYPAGSLYVPGAERIVPQLAALTQFASSQKIPVISTVDAHGEDDPEFHVWPHHCIAGTVGQAKIASTSLPKAVVLGTAPDAWARVESQVNGAAQIIVEKQTLDPFDNPHLPALLASLRANRFYVYGVVSEVCVQHALFGLLKTGVPVYLVSDAIKSLDEAQERAMLERFAAGGGRLTNTAVVLQSTT